MKNREKSAKFTTLKPDIIWIVYKAQTKIGLPANIDEPCNKVNRKINHINVHIHIIKTEMAKVKANHNLVVVFQSVSPVISL